MPHYLTNVNPKSYYDGSLEAAVKMANQITEERIELHKHPMPDCEFSGDSYVPDKSMWSIYAPDNRHDLSKWWSVFREFALYRDRS